MITPDYARTMAAYNAELNRRVYDAARRLPDAVRRADGGVFWRSIHGTLCHILWADQIWLSRFGACEAPSAEIRDSDRIVDGFDELWGHRQVFDEVILGWASALTVADLIGDIAWFSVAIDRHVVRSRTLVIMHVFNHQTHHRGQAHSLITRAGESTGDMDLTFVLSE